MDIEIGNSNECSLGLCITSDNFGNIYRVGTFKSKITLGEYVLNTNSYALYISKQNRNLEYDWVTMLGEFDHYSNLCTTSINNSCPYYDENMTASIILTKNYNKLPVICVAGTFIGNLKFNSNKKVKIDPIGNTFILYLSSMGLILDINILFGSPYGKIYMSENDGYTYITGSFDKLLKLGQFTLKSKNISSYVAKICFDNHIVWLWAKQPISHFDQCMNKSFGIATNNKGISYIIGCFTINLKFPGFEIFDQSMNLPGNIPKSYIVCIDTMGKWLYGCCLSRTHNDFYYSINIDNCSNIYISGISYDKKSFVILVKFSKKLQKIWMKSINVDYPSTLIYTNPPNSYTNADGITFLSYHINNDTLMIDLIDSDSNKFNNISLNTLNIGQIFTSYENRFYYTNSFIDKLIINNKTVRHTDIRQYLILSFSYFFNDEKKDELSKSCIFNSSITNNFSDYLSKSI